MLGKYLFESVHDRFLLSSLSCITITLEMLSPETTFHERALAVIALDVEEDKLQNQGLHERNWGGRGEIIVPGGRFHRV